MVKLKFEVDDRILSFSIIVFILITIFLIQIMIALDLIFTDKIRFVIKVE